MIPRPSPAACPDEPGRSFDWFTSSAGHFGSEPVQIVYGVEGEPNS